MNFFGAIQDMGSNKKFMCPVCCRKPGNVHPYAHKPKPHKLFVIHREVDMEKIKFACPFLWEKPQHKVCCVKA